MPHGMTCTTLCSKAITIRLFFHDHLVFSLVCMYWIKRNFFSLTISAFQGQWTINWMQCKTDKKTPANKQCMDQYLKRNAAALWSACLAGNEVWQKVKTSCIREDQALFQALLLAFGDVQNCAAFLYFKTNFWKVSCSQWYDFWKGRTSLTKRSLLEWLSVCQDRDDAFLGVWLHVPSEWNLPVCEKTWNKIMQECRYKNEHTKGQCSAFFCRIHWIYLGYFNSFILVFSLLAMIMSVFTSEAHWKLPCAFLLCVLRALHVAFSVCTSESSGMCIFLQCHFMISQGNATHSTNLFYFSGVMGTVK